MRAKRMMVGVVAAVLLIGATGCAPMKILDVVKEQNQTKEQHQEQLDYDEIIDSFVADTYNTFKLEVGETHKPSAALWVKKGNGQVYSSDEDVVTVTKYGKVTAEEPGTAYVIIVGSTGMYEVYQYTVVEGAINEEQNQDITTEEPPKESEDIDFGRVF